MGDGRGKNGCNCQYGDERSDEETEADFRQSLGSVTTGLTVLVTRFYTANDTEDDAHSVENFSKLYVPPSDERLVASADARCDAAQQATQNAESALFVSSKDICW